MSILTNKYLLVGAAAAGLAVAYMMRKTAGAVAEAVNPFNNDNVINQTATSWYQALTGSTGTIGTDLYDATHGGILTGISPAWLPIPGAAAAGAAYKLAQSGAFTDGSMNPASTNNVIYRNIGGDDWSIGTKIYDWMN